MHEDPVAFFPCLSAHCCLPEDREKKINGFATHGGERKEAKVANVGSYQPQKHLRCWYLGLAMLLQLCTRVRAAQSPCSSFTEEHGKLGSAPGSHQFSASAQKLVQPEGGCVPVYSHAARATGLSRETGPGAPVTAITR